MLSHRIVITNKGSYIVQEKFLFFFWVTQGEPKSEFGGGYPYEFQNITEARKYIKKLRGEDGCKPERIVEYQ